MSNGMSRDPMEPQVESQAPDVPISVDAFVNRLQQRYGKMVAELMQENAELGAGIAALREAVAERNDQMAGMQAAFAANQTAVEGLLAESTRVTAQRDALEAEVTRLRSTWTPPTDGIAE